MTLGSALVALSLAWIPKDLDNLSHELNCFHKMAVFAHISTTGELDRGQVDGFQKVHFALTGHNHPSKT